LYNDYLTAHTFAKDMDSAVCDSAKGIYNGHFAADPRDDSLRQAPASALYPIFEEGEKKMW
jgi:hypothetical protein